MAEEVTLQDTVLKDLKDNFKENQKNLKDVTAKLQEIKDLRKKGNKSDDESQKISEKQNTEILQTLKENISTGNVAKVVGKVLKVQGVSGATQIGVAFEQELKFRKAQQKAFIENTKKTFRRVTIDIPKKIIGTVLTPIKKVMAPFKKLSDNIKNSFDKLKSGFGKLSGGLNNIVNSIKDNFLKIALIGAGIFALIKFLNTDAGKNIMATIKERLKVAFGPTGSVGKQFQEGGIFHTFFTQTLKPIFDDAGETIKTKIKEGFTDLINYKPFGEDGIIPIPEWLDKLGIDNLSVKSLGGIVLAILALPKIVALFASIAALGGIGKKGIAKVLGKGALGVAAAKTGAKVVAAEAGEKVVKEATEGVVKKGALKVATVGAKGFEMVNTARGVRYKDIATGKFVTQGVAEAGGVVKVAGKPVGKAVGKGIGKAAIKKIPVSGLLAGLGFAVSRALEGDFAGAGLEIASGAASLVPGVGTAGSLAIDAALVARDVTQANEEGEPQAAIDSLPPEQQPNFADGNLLTDPQLNQTALLSKVLGAGGNNQIVNSTNVTNNNFNQYQEFKAIPDQNPLSEYAQLYAV